MIHYFPEDYIFEEPSEFTDPFRYAPHSAVKAAAEDIMRQIERSDMAADFTEGKMLGVLVCRSSSACFDKNGSSGRSGGWSDAKKSVCYIAAFSGNVGGRSIIEGFVPPVYDLLDPSGEFKRREAEITEVNRLIDRLTSSEEYSGLKNRLVLAESRRDKELADLRQSMAESKRRRNATRSVCRDSSVLDALIKESQHEKAELKRLKASWEERITAISTRLEASTERIKELKRQRVSMSESLQDWIFRQYIVHNAYGEMSSIADIFAAEGLTPPGGTGECAAPKLLEYAYLHGLEPLAMGEFWYGQPSETAVRTHGRFYPSCTSKCGPLLGFMLRGIRRFRVCNHGSSLTDSNHPDPIIIHEDDDIIIVEKPSGMPSVPGLDGKKSLLEWLTEHNSDSVSTKTGDFVLAKQKNDLVNTKTGDFVLTKQKNELVSTKTGDFVLEVFPVHRLDMDTSGVMIFAKTSQAAVNLRRQFEEHTVRKTYMARVSRRAAHPGNALQESASGYIDLPLSPDYDERPRQKVDFKQGKSAYTEYETVAENPDGTIDLLLYPRTGRTHQLRVHCAHVLGLARPIVGDLLYGGDTADRLHLHALSITFSHPSTGETKTFSSPII